MATGEHGGWAEPEYFSYAIQFYVAARFSVSNRFTPVVGELFHHAIELYLKGVLTRTMPYEDRMALKHRLNAIWREFKRATGAPGLERFDPTIRTLHRFSHLRYPDDPRARAARTYVLDFVDDPAPIPEADGTGRQFYHLAPNEIAELVRTIYHVAGVEPNAFHETLTPQARHFFDRLDPIRF